jgi:hypothetical protein
LAGAECPAVAEGDVAVAGLDVPRLTEIPMTAASTAAATIDPTLLLLVDISRRIRDRRSGLAMGAEADGSDDDAGGGGGVAPAPAELSATDGPDVADGGRVPSGPVDS